MCFHLFTKSRQIGDQKSQVYYKHVSPLIKHQMVIFVFQCVSDLRLFDKRCADCVVGGDSLAIYGGCKDISDCVCEGFES